MRIGRCVDRIAAVLSMILLSLLAHQSAQARGKEVAMSENPADPPLAVEVYEKLDDLERKTLDDADRTFLKGEFRTAIEKYDGFLLTYNNSPATPYVVFRKARSQHLREKRFDAIKIYQEVLDYFPNDIRYAAPSKFYIGLCHAQNGNDANAMKTWAEMVKDAGYVRHPLGADALLRLADNLEKQEKFAEAVNYYKRVALNFRVSNWGAANTGIGKILPYLMLLPNEPELRDFYVKMSTFAEKPVKVTSEELLTNEAYLRLLMSNVWRLGNFKPEQESQRNSYFKYWAGILDHKYPNSDDWMLDMANMHRMYEGDTDKWIARVDKQFQDLNKRVDYTRITRWIGIWSTNKVKHKALEYYNMIDFEKMNNQQIIALMKTIWDQLENAEMAKNCYAKIKLQDLPDREKAELAKYMERKDEKLFVDICMVFDDKNQGKWLLLEFYARKIDEAKAIPLADELLSDERYALPALTTKAKLYESLKKWQEAIAVWQQCDNPPANSWAIANCYKHMGNKEAAYTVYKEIENFFKNEAPKAALAAAYLWKENGDAEKNRRFIAEMNALQVKYPGTREASTSHVELEELGQKQKKDSVVGARED